MSDSLYQTCPLDPVHIIQKHRMQTHLVKCKKNHDMTKKSICPYNCTHIVDTIVFEHHVQNCEDARSVQQFTYNTDHRPLKGILTVEEIVKRQAEQMANNPCEEESWDTPQRGRGGYDPKKYIEGKNIFRHISVAPKSERKAFREAEIQRHRDLENSTIVPASRRYMGVVHEKSKLSLASLTSSTASLASTQTLGKLRLPRTESHTMSMDNLSLGKMRKDILASQNNIKQKDVLDKWINAAENTENKNTNNDMQKPNQNQQAKSVASALNEISYDLGKMTVKDRGSYDQNFPQGLGKRLAPKFGNNSSTSGNAEQQQQRFPSIGRGISTKSLTKQPGGSPMSSSVSSLSTKLTRQSGGSSSSIPVVN